MIVIVVYWIASEARQAANPNDKLLPSFQRMLEALWRMASEPDRRSGELLLWTDTWASLKRLFIGVFSGAVVGLLVGINAALFPLLRRMLGSFITVLSIIPPLTLLPILFIVFGVGEEAKVVLIFIGTVFVVTRDIILATVALPREQITKALTLGASNFAVVYRVVLPQIMPRLINTTRLTLGAAWLFLIAAEMIAATEGLGYRIGLVRRYLAMDVIIPYVMWITLLGFLVDWALRLWVTRAYAWYHPESGK
ncbi:MAG: ABC transporter permease [Alphaproteobacteria bacterium]|nr:ABC transporter permease [Alphaproteobacteria bacterium]